MSGRPDAMDHELGMLYRLRVKLEDELHSATFWERDPTSPRGWGNPRDLEQPGLRRALAIITEEIKLRTHP